MDKYNIIHYVDIDVDESKFTPEFLKSFSECFYDFETIEDHKRHLARLFVNGIIHENSTFIEGYGDPSDFGIKLKLIDYGVEKL